jgi:hypothetical protein
MKKLAAYTLFFCLVGFQLSAQDNKEEKRQTVYKGVSDQACAVEMAFGSYGAGIDRNAFEQFTKLAEVNKIEYTSKSIGREGETRICMPMTGWSATKKKKIIKKLKAIADKGQLVSVSIR